MQAVVEVRTLMMVIHIININNGSGIQGGTRI
jgi:hypothetical protein